MTDSNKPFPKALPPPESVNTPITEELIDELILWSQKSPRKRIILPLHKTPGANLHRMLNAMQPGTYVQPHRHLFPPKAESIIVLKGGLNVIVFNEDGSIQEVYSLQAGSPRFGMDSEPGVYHTFVVTEPDTVIFEVKPGPYNPADDKDFADWAPKEGSSEAAAYLQRIEKNGKERVSQ